MAEKTTEQEKTELSKIVDSENSSDDDDEPYLSDGELNRTTESDISALENLEELTEEQKKLKAFEWLRKKVKKKELNIVLGKECSPRNVTQEPCKCNPGTNCGGEWVYVSKPAIRAVLRRDNNFIPCEQVIVNLEGRRERREWRLRKVEHFLTPYFGIDIAKRIRDDLQWTQSTINLMRNRREQHLQPRNNMGGAAGGHGGNDDDNDGDGDDDDDDDDKKKFDPKMQQLSRQMQSLGTKDEKTDDEGADKRSDTVTVKREPQEIEREETGSSDKAD